MASALDFEKLLRATLLSSTALTTIVGQKVFDTIMPQGTLLPAVTFQKLSGSPANCLYGPTGLENIEVQIDAWAMQKAQVKEMAKAIRAIMPATGAMWGARLTMDEDMFDEEAKVYRVCMSYDVWFLES